MQIYESQNCNNTKFRARIKLSRPKRNSLIEKGLITGAVTSVGIGNTILSGALLDQSVNYPILGSENLPKQFLDFAKESELQKSVYNSFFRYSGLGNEIAIVKGSTYSTIGNTLGGIILKLKNKIHSKIT